MDVNESLFLAVGTAAHVSFFTLFTLPNFILLCVCIVALLLAKSIKAETRAVLVNVLFAEVLYSILSCFVYLGYPLRAWNVSHSDFLCSLSFGGLQFHVCTNLFAIVFCAVMVHRFIKYGKENPNRKVIAAYITVTWIFPFIISLLVILGNLADESEGLCMLRNDGSNGLRECVIVAVIYTANILGMSACFCTVLTFCILTHRHMKANAPTTNAKVKKAVFKIIVYHSIKLAILLLQFICGSVFLFVQWGLGERAGSSVAVYAINRVILDISALLTPIISIAILKPVLDALKNVACCNESEAKTGTNDSARNPTGDNTT